MSIRRSLAWAFSGQFLAFAIQFVGLIVISRLLTPHEIGIYAIAQAALGITQVFTTFGIASYIVREAELPPQTLNAAFTVNAILVVCLSILLTAVSFAAEPVLGVHEAGKVLRIMALANLLAIVSFRPAAMFQRDMEFRHLSFISVGTVSVQTFGTIGFALAGASYMSSPYASLLSATVAMILNVTLGRRHVGFGLSLAGWRPIIVFGLQMVSVSGIATLTGRLSDLLLGRFLGVTALGLYGRASQLSAIIFENLYGTATRVVFTQLSKDYRDGGDWRGTYLRSLAMITSFMWPFVLGLAILARPAINLLYGERWLPTAGPLSALLVGQFIGIGFGMNWELFVLRGETGRQARYEVTRLILGVPIFLVGCLFGITGAGVATIIVAMIGFITYYPQINRLADLDRHQMPAVYRISALPTLAAVLPAAVVMATWHWSARTPMPIVAGAVILGVLLWLGAIVVTRHPLLQEFQLIRRRLRPTRLRS